MIIWIVLALVVAFIIAVAVSVWRDYCKMPPERRKDWL